ncbi:hypothetical protein Bca52824_006146 [Brassica carinata]|uniref:Uncharacterized protein n=1 Tax=Brassica carinata TaxID=52824 RepID=A0A8X7WRI4_BRACI|nr:hypothetical protein Bca52824_006146 [Brassica carinata]
MGDQDKEKNVENPEVVQKVVSDPSDQSMTCQVKTWFTLSKLRRVAMVRSVAKPTGLGLRLTRPFGSRPRRIRNQAKHCRIVRSTPVMINAYLVVVSGTKDGSGQAKSREGSISERLCNGG